MSGMIRKGISAFLHCIFIAYLHNCHRLTFYLIFILHIIYNCVFIYCSYVLQLYNVCYFIFILPVQTSAWQTPGSTGTYWDSILIMYFLGAFKWLTLSGGRGDLRSCPTHESCGPHAIEHSSLILPCHLM